MTTKSPDLPLTSFTSFGALLRYLRRRARFTQRDLGIAVGYSEGHICRLEQNERLPDLTALAALFVPALELNHEPETVAYLLKLAATARGERVTDHFVADVTVDQPGQISSNGKYTLPDSTLALSPQSPRPLPYSLPFPITTLFGRAHEVAAVCNSLLRPEVRLLTLTGPPGVGKTRLALRVAELVLDHFLDGVFFVTLAPLNDPRLVASAIAQAFGVAETDAQPLNERLKQQLSGRQSLLVLDNFEHLLPAASLVTELLATTSLKILITSRTALHLSGEHEYPVPPLDLPNMAHLPALELLAQNPAVSLFIERAQAANPHFVLKETNAIAVAAICVRLDGLPLALELAAARTKLLDPQTLLTRLHRRLPLLTRGPRDQPARHQTLKDAIVWSYDLLPADAQRLFARLGVFAGGCSLRAIETICGEVAADAVSTSDTLIDRLQVLLDSSLVQVHEQNGVQRIILLETIREYALDRLEANDEGAFMHRRHAAYFYKLAEETLNQQEGKNTKAWFDRLECDHDNMRAALQWLLANDVEAAQQLAGALGEFWHKQGYWCEGRSWLAQTLAHSQKPTLVRARSLLAAGQLAFALGERGEARLLLEAALQLYRQLQDVEGTVSTLQALGWLEFVDELFPRAVELFEEGLRLSRLLNKPAKIANLLYAVSHLHIMNGDEPFYPIADSYLEEGLGLYRRLNDPDGIGAILEAKAGLALMSADYARAVAFLREAMVIHRKNDNKYTIPLTLYALGDAERLQGDLEAAANHWQEGLQLYQESQIASGIMVGKHHLARLARLLGNLEEAVQLYQSSAQMSLELKDNKILACSLVGLASIALVQSHYEDAASLLAGAQKLFDHLPPFLAPADREEYAQSIALVRTKLGVPVFTSIWRAAQMLAPDEVLCRYPCSQ